MAIQIPVRPTEVAVLLGTDNPREQAKRVRQLLEPLRVLTILDDPRTGRIQLSTTGQELTIEQALILLEQAREALLDEHE